MSMNLLKSLAAKRELSYCSICGNSTDEDPQLFVETNRVINLTILIVEDSRDVSAMENIQEYGLRHVSYGHLISPMNGIDRMISILRV